ncbi:MAG TPA: FAD-binding oxidoreductase [Fimbriimonas sp.]|nr:FAD-binding oxidoreductase [Fimbriimonas sp.]
MSHVLKPGTTEELCQIVQESDLVFADNVLVFPNQTMVVEPRKLTIVSRSQLDSLIDIQPQNQTVTVGAGMKLSDLKQHLFAHQQVIPIRFNDYFSAPMKSNVNHLYELIDRDLPHTLMAQHGSWSDWILEAKIVLADGTCVKSGAKVVKSVSGYDLHKLLIGARASLGLVVEVTLRTIPFPSLQPPNVETKEAELPHQTVLKYQRVCQSDWALLCDWVRANTTSYSLDHASQQAFFPIPPGSEAPRFMGEITWDWRYGVSESIAPDVAKLMNRAKQVFDPTNKLNPGVFGFL